MGLKALFGLVASACLGVAPLAAQTPPPAANPIQPVQATQPPLRAPLFDPNKDAPVGFSINLDPPGPERLFRLESEDSLKERMRQEKRTQANVERIVFPETVVLPSTPYDPTWREKNWLAMERAVEPYYLVHGRLLFQQLNFERYGWDLGPVTPFVSAGSFIADFLMVPYNLAKDPFRRWDASSGWALPGDPTPLMIYPVGVSASGSLTEAIVVFAIIACFP